MSGKSAKKIWGDVLRSKGYTIEKHYRKEVIGDPLNDNEKTPRKSYLDKYVEVCAECLTASCWHGEFMCEKAQHAGTVLKTTRELNALDKESRGNYSAEKLLAVCGGTAPHGYK